MEVLSEANFAMAKSGCYQCTNPGIGVAFDASIVGEGALYLCRNCLYDAANLLGWEADKGKDVAINNLLEQVTNLTAQLEIQDALVKTLNKAYTLHKAREAKSGKRSAGGGTDERLVDVGRDDGVHAEDDRPAVRADQRVAGPAGGEEPGAVQGDGEPALHQLS